MRKHYNKLALGTLLLASLSSVGCGSDQVDEFLVRNPYSTVNPIAVNDVYTVRGNGQLAVDQAHGVFGNDQSNLGAAAVDSGPSRGTLVLDGDGSFVYTPNPGVYNATDSFTYIIRNDVGTSSATVLINIGGPSVFVDNSFVGSPTGQQGRPFLTLADAVAQAAGIPGSEIVVAEGNGGLYTSAVAIPAGVNVVAADAANPPVFGSGMTLTQNNQLRDLRFTGVQSTAINGDNSSNCSLTNVVVEESLGSALTLNNASGNWTVQNCTFDSNGAAAVSSNSSTGSLNLSVSDSRFNQSKVAGISDTTTGSAAHTLSVTSTSFVNGQDLADEVFLRPGATAVDYRLTLSGNTFNGGGFARRGVDVVTSGSTTLRGLISANSVTGFSNDGARLAVDGTSTAVARFVDNSLRGNRLTGGNGDLVVNTVPTGTGTFAGVFQRNTADLFFFNRSVGTVFGVELLSQFNGSQGNVGTLQQSTTPAPTELAAGAAGAP